MPIAWTIAGSDPGGGAGIQADLKTMNRLGVHGCAVIAALTAQNTVCVSRTESVSAAMLEAQLAALEKDLPPVALKLGMLGDKDGIAVLVKHLKDLKTLKSFVLYDPVLISTTGHALLSLTVLEEIKATLLPEVDLLTPNLMEAEALLGRVILGEKNLPEAMEQAASDLLSLGIKRVFLKGGHGEGAYSQDFYTDGVVKAWLTSPRQETRQTHGTGCTLSAAITACVAQGYSVLDALVIAKAYVNQGLRLAPGLGQGYGPLAHGSWPESEEDLPWLTETAQAGQQRLQFPQGGKIGFYPIVDRTAAMKPLLEAGVSTIQLRIKDLTGEALDHEIAMAVSMASRFGACLFVNDHWELALKHQAYGVHLGQRDLKTADLIALSQSNIRLGVSTHCYEEVARALSLQPSYMAIGPIFPTTTKDMPFSPQGLIGLRRWRKTLSYPLVAIGGMFLDNAPDVLATGVDGIAVVRDITQAADVPAQARRWLSLCDSAEVSLVTA